MFIVTAIMTEEEVYNRLERKYQKLERMEKKIFEKLTFLERRISDLIKLDNEIRRYSLDDGK